MDARKLRIQDYTYDLDDEKIAKYPLEKRDSSKLLIYQNEKIEEDTYANIAAHIPSGSLLIFNQTKVVNARLLFKKETGGLIEVFCIEPDDQYKDMQTAMLQKSMVHWKCMIGGASKWKHGMILQLKHPDPDFTLYAKIIAKASDTYIIELFWDKTDLAFAELLHYTGKVPLPPYLHREAEAKDEDTYQTIFAKEEGSVAAPTAGLHFTESVMRSLEQKNITTGFVSLHVGAGTFKPVKSDTMEDHEMHAEWMELKLDTIKQLIAYVDKGVIAVGTTSARTLESLYWIGAKLHNNIQPDFNAIAVSQWDPYEISAGIDAKEALDTLCHWMQDHKLDRLITRTRILIAPGYDFKIIKGLVTNFHQPRSTLLLLVSALIGDNWRKVYDHALHNGYRFLSYGDGCLLWK